MKQANPRILCDLSLTMSGYSGIPQDARLLFKILTTMDGFDTAGLIFPKSKDLLGLKTHRESQNQFQRVMAQSNFFAELIDQGKIHHYLELIKLPQKTLNQLAVFRRNFSLAKLDPGLFEDVIWRTMMEFSLPPQDYEHILEQNYYLSDLNRANIIFSALFRSMAPKLNTKGWDYVVFQDAVKVRVSPGTRKIVRYHDMIPALKVDTVQNAAFLGSYHLESVNACKDDAIFVCNTEATREDLLRVFPELEPCSHVVPCAVPVNYQPQHNQDAVVTAIRTRLSKSSISNPDSLGDRQQILDRIFEGCEQGKAPKYIMSLATLEPRKNYLSLIRAWEQLRYRYGTQIKLMIVGAPGWKYESIIRALRPHVYEGNIIHLEKVTPEELPYLYSAAECFVFPSYYEGFGLPPVEAMQCDCPVIISDIPAHRWVSDDAAEYCNPYDVDSICDAMARLTIAEGKEQHRKQLIEKGRKRSQRFAQEHVTEEWEQLFQTIAKEN